MNSIHDGNQRALCTSWQEKLLTTRAMAKNQAFEGLEVGVSLRQPLTTPQKNQRDWNNSQQLLKPPGWSVRQ